MIDLEVAEAWSAKPGETVLLRLTRALASDRYHAMRLTLDDLTERTGIHFVLLSPDVEVVNPHTGAST